ncbi:hypothetical protein D9M71_705150 [compost metagenome]
MANKIIVYVNTFTRPYLSANTPKIIPPSSIPIFVMDEINPPVARSILNSAIIIVIAKEINIMSIPSSVSPATEATTVFLR